MMMNNEWNKNTDQEKMDQKLEVPEERTDIVEDSAEETVITKKKDAPQRKKKKSSPEPEDENPKGSLLKEVRLRKGISLENVHEATKIPMDALRAIEEGYKVRTLTPFYIKGFMKIYAKYLDVDVSQVVEEPPQQKFKKPVHAEKEDFQFQKRFSDLLTKKQKQQIVLVLGAILGLFITVKVLGFIFRGISGLFKKDRRPRVEQVSQQKSPIEKTVRVVKNPVETPFVKSKRDTEQKKESSSKARVAVKTPEPEPVKKTVQPVSASATVPQQGQQVPSDVRSLKNVTLTVRAQKDSWLRVKADEDVVFQSTLRRGTVETWMADKDIEITGKNIASLEFELNGKMLGTLGRKDRRVKKVVVTEKGLTVTK